MKVYTVYILTNWDDSVMYVGCTSDLPARVDQHKQKLVSGFTARYNLNKLVYYEQTTNIESAFEREIQIKKWGRAKKNALVETFNPAWSDLSFEL